MCAQERLVLALYGASCTGKTTVARILAKELNCSLRSAGDAIRARSLELNVPQNSLALDEHRKIDETTRAMARSSVGPLVIEGTFLGALLFDLKDIRRIKLICAEGERRRRWESRGGTPLHSRDDADRRLRQCLHGCRADGTPDITIETSSRTPEEIAKEINTWVQTKDDSEKPS